MHPVLFTFPDWIPLIAGKSIHVYGVMIAVGFLLGLFYLKRESRRVGQDEEKIVDLFFGIIIAGLVGSRLLFVINEASSEFFANPLMFFKVWEGGLVFQGGVILSIIYTIYFCRKNDLKFFTISDICAPALSMGHALGRIGCFFAGCCHGRECPVDYPFALIFPKFDNGIGIAPPGVPLYPTQIFESLGEWVILGLLLSFRKKKPFDGAVFLLYLILYAILRSVVEIYRGDFTRGYIIDPYLSNGQFYSLIGFICAVFLWFYLNKKAKQETVKK